MKFKENLFVISADITDLKSITLSSNLPYVITNPLVLMYKQNPLNYIVSKIVNSFSQHILCPRLCYVVTSKY